MPFEAMQMFNLADDPDESSPLEMKGPEFSRLQKALTEHYRNWGSVPFQKKQDQL